VQGFGYDLILPSEIQGKKKKIRATSSIGSSMYFNVTLNEIMEMQTEELPDLPIPRVFDQLVKALHRLKGTETEGIFRVACDTTEMNSVIANLESDNFACLDTVKSPHVISNVLKKWLRDLKDPVFPFQFYPVYSKLSQSDIDEAAVVALLDSFPLVGVSQSFSLLMSCLFRSIVS
jgi:hypothetical protein